MKVENQGWSANDWDFWDVDAETGLEMAKDATADLLEGAGQGEHVFVLRIVVEEFETRQNVRGQVKRALRGVLG